MALVLVNASAVAMAFVPLFNLVGYESAAFYGVVLGVLATGLTVYSVKSGAVDAPLDESRRRRPADDFGRLALVHLTLALGPLAILTVNGFRVLNCDWVAGFAFWALIVGPAVLIGQAAAWLALSLVPEKKGVAWLLAFAFPVGDALALIYHLATEPPIIGHQWFLGYFGGSIYDEAMAVPPSLIAYRVLHLLAIIAVVAAIQAVFELNRGRLPRWTMVLVFGASLSFVVGFAERDRFGISIDRVHIAEELGGMVESEHFVIYYPETRRSLQRLEEMVADHEFRYDQLRRFFGTDPVAESGEKVASFVYADRDSKGKLMGARHTMVAKLWLHEMHILWSGTGDHMLTHELAHIFTEPFGAGPLSLSMQRGVGVNMGLVEGIASAAEWRSQELTLHEASAAMRRLDLSPDLRTILGASGFWTEASGPAYTAMGSFVRYLVDTRGIEAFKKAYPSGDFYGAYGVEVESLIEEWEEFVDELALTERQKSVARHRYDRTSIFGKVCARALADIREEARRAASSGAYGKARASYEQYLDDDPHHVAVRRSYARILGELDEVDEALAVLEDLLSADLTTVETAQVFELRGDVLWSEGNDSAAADAYDDGLRLAVPVHQERSLQMKKRLAERGDDRGRQILVDRRSEAEVMYQMMSWRRDAPEDPIPAYFVGRRLWQERNYSEAISHLEDSRHRLDAAVLDAEVSLMLGQSYYFEGHLDASDSIWKKLAESRITRYRETAREWATRIEWARRNRQ